MGVQINLKDVDFGNSGFTFYKANLEQGGPNVVVGSPNFGKLDGASETKRLKALPIVYVEEGQTVTFYGLKGKDADNNDCTLRVDGVAYSQKNNPSHSTAVASISNSSSSYYHLNDELNDECSWVNDIGSYWFVFGFGSNHVAATSVAITPAGFDIAIRVSE